MSSKQAAIAELAYLLWESRGRPEHTAERDWAEAETLIAGQSLPSGGELAESDVLPTLTAVAGKTDSRRKTDRKPKATVATQPSAEPRATLKTVKKAAIKKTSGDSSAGAGAGPAGARPSLE